MNSLRASQAWADLQAAQSAKEVAQSQKENTSSSIELKTGQSSISGTNETPLDVSVETKAESNVPSVAGLLSQLSSTSSQPVTRPSAPYPVHNHALSQHSTDAPSLHDKVNTSTGNSALSPQHQLHPIQQNLRTVSFQQSLPIVSSLSEDPSFVEAVLQLRKDQDDLEQHLWDERQQIIEAQTEKVKVAMTKANMVGAGISERQANSIREGFVKQLDKFNTDRVFPAWDALVLRQQGKLETLGVPTMYRTESGLDRHRQQRIVQVLEGVTGTEDLEDILMA